MSCKNFRMFHRWTKWSSPKLVKYNTIKPKWPDVQEPIATGVGTFSFNETLERWEQQRHCKNCNEHQARIVYLNN